MKPASLLTAPTLILIVTNVCATEIPGDSLQVDGSEVDEVCVIPLNLAV